MRILALFQEPDRCEAEICAAMAAQGVQIVAYVNPGARYAEILKTSGVQLKTWVTKSRFNLTNIRLVQHEIHHGQIDVIHCFSNRALACSLLARIPSHIGLIAYRGTMGHLSYFSPLSWLSYLHPRLDKVICVSEAVRSYMQGFLPANKLVRIYKGHNPDWYKDIIPMSPANLGIEPNTIIVSCLANMRPVKGVSFLLEAFKLLEDPNISLMLVGKVQDSEIPALLKDDSFKRRIKLLGYRTDALACIAASDIFVMPSIEREGLPKALIEAMSLGIAPIVSSVGGMPEVVENKKSGLIVPPMSPQALAEAITVLSHNTAMRLRIADAARERTKDFLPIAATVAQTLAVYKEVHVQRLEIK